ncbi:bifunctional DNA primase/polymerase [Mycobacteroides abscessus]|uniref:bifunctional DNA primase/polymerase n=1 Tax=Mycobacteroides abscessus TaxID=36809 RepID=UPI00148F4649|nr:hypothetical protein [Mycobacteroides abscessus]
MTAAQSNPAHRTFTGHSVFGEVPFTAAEDAAIDAALAARATNNSTWATITTAAQFHAMPLKRGRKTPSNSGWTSAPALNEKSIGAHLNGGGNVGALLGASGERGLIAWDLDNELATEAVTAAGYRTITIPANSYNPNHSKGRFGGRHAVWAVPAEWGVDGMSLTAPNATVTLANGGTADVLTGAKFIVLPPSVLCEEGHLAYYNPVEAAWPGPVEPLPVEYWPDRWRPADAPEPPAGLEAFRVDIRPKTVFDAAEERYLSGGSIELTEKVDAVPWAQYLELDTENLITVLNTVDSCGCNKLHFSKQSHDDGGVLHDGCSYGNGVHVHSGSLAAHLAGNGEHRDHMSRLDFTAALIGRDLRDVARSVGVELRGGREEDELTGITAEEFEAMAAAEAVKGNAAAAAGLRETAARRRAAVLEYMEQRGETFTSGQVLGAPAASSTAAPDLHVIPGGLHAAPPIGTVANTRTVGATALAPVVAPQFEQPEPAAAPGPVPQTDGQDEDQSEADAQAAAQAKAEAHMARADAPELLDAVFCTPLLSQIRARADKAQVSPMLALSANINGLLSVVPHQVCLPKLTGKRRQPLNLITVPVDESGGGKGGATTVDIDPVPHGSGTVCVGLPSNVTTGGDGVEKIRRIPSPVPAGSGEAIAECYAYIEKCKESGEKISVNHSESAWLAWDEVAKILAVRDRKGSTIEPELCHGWSWETLGSKTKTNPFWVEARTYRMLVTICAQLVTAAGLLADEYTGLVQRIWWVSAAYTISEEDAAPEKLAEGRRTADGEWFSEPDDEEPLILVELPEWPSDGVLRVAASVAAEIEAARANHGRGRKAHPWDRHQLLIRLRLAAAGAIMHGCADVTAEWWAWAGLLIEHSKHVRDAVVALRGTATTKAATEDGQKDALRAEARQSAQWRRAVDSTERWAAKQASEKADGLFTELEAKRAAGPGFRKDNMADILAALYGVGKLIREEVYVPQAGGNVLKFRYVGPTAQRGEKG